MATSQGEAPHEYRLSERRFSGSREEVLQQLDELIEALMGFRQSLTLSKGGEKARPGASSPTRRARHAAFLIVAFLLGVAAATTLAQSASAPPPATAGAQGSGKGTVPPIQYAVTLEGYYEFNANEPYDRVNDLRAYDPRANVFSIQQAAVVLEGAPDVEAGRRFGARLDLQFGQATETVQGSPANEPRPDVYRHVWQAYGTYIFPLGQGLQADFGKFASNLGFETNYAKDNHHFSRAYLFNFLPFYHAGLRLSLPIHDRATVMYMLTNGIQQTEDFNNFKSHHLTAIVKPASRLSWTTSYYFGQEQPDRELPDGPDGYFRVFESYAGYAVTDRLSLGLDVNYVTNEVLKEDDALSLQGIGAYARYQVGGPAALAVRYERLDDEGLFGGVSQLLQEVTATAEYKFAEGFLVRGEFRRDWSNQRFFTGRDAGDLRESQTTVLAGLVWWFGTKQGAW